MRVHARSVLAVLFLSSFCMTLAVFAPASVFLSRITAPANDIDFSYPRGTLWHGESQSVRVNGVPIGGVTFAVSAFSSGGLVPALSWRSQGRMQHSRGVVGMRLGGDLFVRDVSVSLALSSLALPVNMDGNISMDIEQGAFSNGDCTLISGDANISGRLMSLNQESVVLRGPVSCENGVVQVRMAGTLGPIPANLTLAYESDLVMTYDAVLRDGDQTTAAFLSALGFRRNGSTYELSGQAALTPEF